VFLSTILSQIQFRFGYSYSHYQTGEDKTFWSQHSDFNDGFVRGEDETGEENVQGAAFKEM